MGFGCFFSNKNSNQSVGLEKYSDERLKGSIIVIKENNKFIYKRREDLNFSSEKLIKIMEKFYLEKEDLQEMWKFFKQINEDKSGFITIDDLYILLKEKQSNSIIAPYLDRFFLIVDKRFYDKSSFEELVSNIISYCLYSIFQIIKFVFDFIDKNGLGYITKHDVIKLVDTHRENQPIYLRNHCVAISQYNFRRNDKINLEDFSELCDKMPFVYFPAIHFQNCLRRYYINSNFWEKIKEKTIQKHKKNLKYKAEIKINEKIEGYNKQIEKKNYDRNKDNPRIFMEKLRISRRNSDTNFYLIYKYAKIDNKKGPSSSSNICLFCN